VLVIGVVPAQGAAPSVMPHNAKHCHRHGRHRRKPKPALLPRPDQHHGSFPRATAEGQEHAVFLTSPPPVKVGLGRTGLMFTCQPSGQQAFIQR
jgi:hypothetical protein